MGAFPMRITQEFFMTRLNLSPLPSLRLDEVSGRPAVEKNGFVDDSVVMALVAGPSSGRTIPDQAELALAADHLDFAGWCLTSPLPMAATQPGRSARSVATTSRPIQRPTPPVSEEPGLGEPHHGQHRWWLAALAGAVSTLMITVLLLSLSTRISTNSSGNILVETLARPKPSTPTERENPRKPAPQLTEASP